jgi:hypothetical protein
MRPTLRPGACLALKLLLDLVKQLAIDDRFMLSRVLLAFAAISPRQFSS